MKFILEHHCANQFHPHTAIYILKELHIGRIPWLPNPGVISDRLADKRLELIDWGLYSVFTERQPMRQLIIGKLVHWMIENKKMKPGESLDIEEVEGDFNIN